MTLKPITGPFFKLLVIGALFAMLATVQGQALSLSSTTATVCSARGNVLVDPGFELPTPLEQGGWMLGGGVFADVSSGGMRAVASTPCMKARTTAVRDLASGFPQHLAPNGS